MGAKTIISGLVFTPDHLARGTRGGYQLEATRRGAVTKIEEAIRDLRLLVSAMPAGDANVATVAGLVQALT